MLPISFHNNNTDNFARIRIPSYVYAKTSLHKYWHKLDDLLKSSSFRPRRTSKSDQFRVHVISSIQVDLISRIILDCPITLGAQISYKWIRIWSLIAFVVNKGPIALWKGIFLDYVVTAAGFNRISQISS